jgi:hypothetical protein
MKVLNSVGTEEESVGLLRDMNRKEEEPKVRKAENESPPAR